MRPALTPGHDLTHLADVIASMDLENLHGMVQFCRRLRRDLVLNGGRGIDAMCGRDASFDAERIQ